MTDEAGPNLDADHTRERNVLIAFFVLCAIASIYGHIVLHWFFYEPDSISYLSIADNILHGHGYRTFEGDWCADWPPLVPVLLSMGLAMHLPQPYPFALLDMASITVIVAIAGGWLFQLTGSTKLTAAALAIAIFSPALQSISNAGYTECLFTALCLGALVAIDRYMAGKSVAILVIAAILSALAMLTRYMGIALVITVCIVLLSAGDRAWIRRVSDSAGYVIISCTPIVLWCLVNHRETGTYTGPRSAPELTFWANLGHAAFFILLSFGAGIILVALLSIIRRGTGDGNFPWGQNLRLLAFPSVFVALLVVSASLVDVDPPDNRLLAPAFIPLFVWILATAWNSAKGSPRLTRQLSIALCAWFAINCTLMAFMHPAGFLDPRWTQSGLMAAVRTISARASIYSNDAAACYFLGHRSAHSALDDGAAPTPKQLEAEIYDLGDGSLVAWFNQGLLDERVTAAQIAHCPAVTVVKKCNDGVLYRVNDPNP